MPSEIVPLEFETAAAFVAEHHRHHTPPAGHKFSLGARDLAGLLAGVVIVGRPVARRRQDGLTLEVTRLCVRPGLAKVVDARGREHADGTCSFLYGAAARATFALGYRRIGTYILKSEPGTSLVAAGWKLIGETPGKSWSVPSRERTDSHPLGPKLLFEAHA